MSTEQHRDTSRADIQDTAVRERIGKWQAIPGPRTGEWVVLSDGSAVRLTADGIRRSSQRKGERLSLVTDDGDQLTNTFYIRRDGTVAHSGVNIRHDAERLALVDTGKTRPGRFVVFEYGDPHLNPGIHFELECRVFRAAALDEVAGDAAE